MNNTSSKTGVNSSLAAQSDKAQATKIASSGSKQGASSSQKTLKTKIVKSKKLVSKNGASNSQKQATSSAKVNRQATELRSVTSATAVPKQASEGNNIK